MTKPIGSKRPLTNHFNSRSVTWIPPLHGSSVRRKDFPKFKSKKAPRHSLQFVQSVSVDFDSHRVKMPKVGWVKFSKNRTFDWHYITGNAIHSHRRDKRLIIRESEVFVKFL